MFLLHLNVHAINIIAILVSIIGLGYVFWLKETSELPDKDSSEEEIELG